MDLGGVGQSYQGISNAQIGPFQLSETLQLSVVKIVKIKGKTFVLHLMLKLAHQQTIRSLLWQVVDQMSS